MKSLVLLIIFVASATGTENLDFPRVQVANGFLTGKVIKTANGEEVNSFLGVPYAEPPVGNLRFRRPVPIQTQFKADFDATQLRSLCPRRLPQLFSIFTSEYFKFEGNRPLSEDCLYVNIWAPKLPGPLRNVIFVINDKAFTGIDWFSGETLAAKSNSIVVSCQHRVGPFGFLYLGTEDAPGNQGLLDQYLALKWVQENIRAFGGNPAEITLFGTSTNGASVSYHLLSPLSQPLFNRAVLSSGAATSYRSFQSQIQAREQALQIIEVANCSKNEALAVDCLRKIDESLLTHLEFETAFSNDGFAMVPTVDNYSITDTPRHLLQSQAFKPKQILIGNLIDFKTFGAPILFDYVFAPVTSSNTTNHQLLSLFRHSILEYRQRIGNAIALNDYNLFLASDGLFTKDFMYGVAKMSEVICPTLEFGNMYNRSSAAVYYYYFEQQFEFDPEHKGIFIGDEGAYFFGRPLNQSLPYTFASRLISVQMMSVLSVFSKTGVPFQGWKGHEPISIFQVQNTTDTTYDFGPSNGLAGNKCNFFNEVVKQW